MNKPSLLKFSLLYVITITTGVMFLAWLPLPVSGEENICTVKSMKFNPGGPQEDTYFTTLSQRPQPTLQINTENCTDKIIKIAIDGRYDSSLLSDPGDRISVIKTSIRVPASGTVNIKYKLGTKGCWNSSFGKDCEYTLKIIEGAVESSTISKLGISYNCTIEDSEICDPGVFDIVKSWWSDEFITAPWEYISDDGLPLVDENTQNHTGMGKCWIVPDLKTGKPGYYEPNCYEPISGLPLKDLEVGGDKLLDKIDENTTVGDYLNSLFALAIGVAGVLGVIMIVIYAYEYLTSSNPGAKVELRNNILQVLLGIVLLLGIYTILKTINPDLLRLDPFVPEAEETTTGTTATPETTPIPMVSVGEGSLDVLEYKYFNAEAILDKKTNEVVFKIGAMFRDGMTKPTQGLEVHIGTSETDTPLVFPLEDVGGATPDIIFFGLNQTKSLATDEQAPTTFYYKIIDVASGDQVKTSEETIASESCTPLEPTNQTPGTQQEADKKKLYNPKRSETDFIEWVNNCRSSISGLEPKKLNLKNDPTQTIDILPCDSDNLVTVSNVFGGKSFQTHKNLKPAIERISQKWQAQGGDTFYEIKEIGGNHCRWMTDREGQVLSNHSYALAIDINPKTNDYMPNYKDPGLTRPRSDYTDMPQAFVQLWKDEGFGWGGDWETKKDAMHFSKMKGGELGNGIVDAI